MSILLRTTWIHLKFKFYFASRFDDKFDEEKKKLLAKIFVINFLVEKFSDLKKKHFPSAINFVSGARERKRETFDLPIV